MTLFHINKIEKKYDRVHVQLSFVDAFPWTLQSDRPFVGLDEMESDFSSIFGTTTVNLYHMWPESDCNWKNNVDFFVKIQILVDMFFVLHEKDID